MTHSILMISVILSLTFIRSTHSGPDPGTSGLYDRKNPVVDVVKCGAHGYSQKSTHYADGSGKREAKFNFRGCADGFELIDNWGAPNADGECAWDFWKAKCGVFSNGIGPANYKFLKGYYRFGGDCIDYEWTVYDIKDGSTRHTLVTGLYLGNRGIKVIGKAGGAWESEWIRLENIWDIVTSVAARYVPMKVLDTFIERLHLTDDMKDGATKWALEQVREFVEHEDFEPVRKHITEKAKFEPHLIKQIDRHARKQGGPGKPAPIKFKIILSKYGVGSEFAALWGKKNAEGINMYGMKAVGYIQSCAIGLFFGLSDDKRFYEADLTVLKTTIRVIIDISHFPEIAKKVQADYSKDAEMK
eukprot:482295_1